MSIIVSIEADFSDHRINKKVQAVRETLGDSKLTTNKKLKHNDYLPCVRNHNQSIGPHDNFTENRLTEWFKVE